MNIKKTGTMASAFVFVCKIREKCIKAQEIAG